MMPHFNIKISKQRYRYGRFILFPINYGEHFPWHCMIISANPENQRFSGDYGVDYLVDCYVIYDTISACIGDTDNKLSEGHL
jgi:hypothetical protein